MVHDRFPKRIEYALIKYIAQLNSRLEAALKYYFDKVKDHVFLTEDFRLNISDYLPHVLFPLPLLGAYLFNIEKLCFDVKLLNPFREDIRIMFSNKMLVPAFSLSISSFTTLQRWTREPLRDIQIIPPLGDKPLVVRKGDYSLLNFYYFRSLGKLEISNPEYLDFILKDILILAAFPSMPTIRNKFDCLLKSLPFLSIYGSDVSGVEALSVSRCLIKFDRGSLGEGYSQKRAIKSLLWGTLPVYKVKGMVLSSSPFGGTIRKEIIYIPEFYYTRIFEECYDSILVDSIVLSLFNIRKRDLMLFNILGVPLNIFQFENNLVIPIILDYIVANMCSSRFLEMPDEQPQISRMLKVNVVISEQEIITRLNNILRCLQIKSRKFNTSLISIKLSPRNILLSNILSYAYVYLLPFSDELSIKVLHCGKSLSISCYYPHILLSILSFALVKGLDFETYRKLMKCIVKIVKENPKVEDPQVLIMVKDKLNEILKDDVHIGYKDICLLFRNIMLAHKLYMCKLKYFKWILKYQ